ncbi:MAG: type I-E CRISPR-associated protein Cse1/CasA, partial [Candidatus Helarchaeota archaeon]
QKDWISLWEENKFSVKYLSIIKEYFLQWHDRFYLIDDKYPFYQVSDLDERKAKTIAKLIPDLSSGNNPTIFDHTLDDKIPEVSYSTAVGWLLAYHNFSLGGLVTPYSSSRITEKDKSAKGSNLAGAALIIAQGETLFQTLLLNLIQYNPEKEIPFKVHEKKGDMPAWERSDPVIHKERFPDGLVDWLTWQSRATKLLSEKEGTISKILNMPGYSLPNKAHRVDYEPMVAFVESKGNDPYKAIGISENRAIWRDSTSLFQTMSSPKPAKSARTPRTLHWIGAVADSVGISTVPLNFFGIASDKASYKLWKHESFPFHPKFLKEELFRENLSYLLLIAERGAKALNFSLKKLIVQLSPYLKQKQESSGHFEKKDWNKINQDLNSLNLESQYWGKVEFPFRSQYIKLINSQTPFTEEEKDNWKKVIKTIGSGILKKFINSSNTNASFWKASSNAIIAFYWRFKRNE